MDSRGFNRGIETAAHRLKSMGLDSTADRIMAMREGIENMKKIVVMGAIGDG